MEKKNNQYDVDPQAAGEETQSVDNINELLRKILGSIKKNGIDILEGELAKQEEIFEANQRKIEELQEELAELTDEVDEDEGLAELPDQPDE